MKPLRPDDPTEGLAEEHEMDQRREDALEKIGKCLRESRTRLLLLTRDAHKRIEDVMAGDGEPGTATEGIPALPARVANGVLAVTARLREAATNWGALLDDAGEQEHYAVGGVAAKLVRKARAVAEFAPRRLLDAGVHPPDAQHGVEQREAGQHGPREARVLGDGGRARDGERILAKVGVDVRARHVRLRQQPDRRQRQAAQRGE